MRTGRFDQRPSGIQAAGELPWGSHFCVFYASQQELLDVLVPFVRAGLESNELCCWAVRAPLTVEQATKALTAGVPDLARYVALGQVEIASSPGNVLWLDDALERRLDRAILAGFDGLRLVRHTGVATTGPALAADTEAIRALNVIAAFLYPRAELGAVGLMQVVQHHSFALVCNSGRWEVLEGSEARIARDALVRSEEKLQSLFRSMSEGFAYHRIVLDADGRPCDYVFLEVSPAFERLTGLVAQKILGKRVTQVLPGIETDPTDWIGRYGRVALTGEPVQFESHAAALDRWYAVSAFSPHKGYFAITLADITDRKRAEAALQASDERHRLLATTMLQGVVHQDREGTVISMNPAAEGILGRRPQDFLGSSSVEQEPRTIRENGSQFPGLEHPAMVALRTGQPVRDVVMGVFNPREDAYRWISIDAVPVFRPGEDKPYEVYTVFADITERRSMEEERTRHLAAIAEANEAKDLFFNTLSHELRTPLAAMLNAVEVLKNPEIGKSQSTRAFGILERNIRQQTWLIDDLLDLSRIMRKKVAIDQKPLDLRDVVREGVEAIEGAARAAQLSLEVEAPPEPVPVLGDTVRLGQVVSNLLTNAVKFNRPGGWIKVRITSENGEAVVHVADNGIGICSGLLTKIFEPFRQAGTSVTRSKGLGIGLTVARSLVELHGGRLEARSNGLGKGSEFSFRLPLQSTAQAVHAAGAPALPGPATRPGRRVLVVEDNPDFRDSLRILLEIMGHSVTAASDGSAAVELARREKPDVALIDIGLPDMDGYAVAKVLRSDPTLKDTRLVALSGYATPEHRERAFAAGFDRHLAKPVDAEDLQQILEGGDSTDPDRA